ncbi:extradiol ring-cleavage dioxygenase [Cryptosporangium sp. NPDC051539]|uniref:DODA-type extradiol aromatic ring-opening family dioxygenase n=1 Tax=Cryptosporangium sp. NPDC051539 TaxID=3363962 RepID=UPI003799538C
MAEVLAGMASSHAYALVDPHNWETRRELSRERFAAKYGTPPPQHPKLADESPEESNERFQKLGVAFQQLRDQLVQLAPDTLIIIGDDQEENYTDTVPQFSLYTGEHIRAYDPESKETTAYRCNAGLAKALHGSLVDQGFDLTSSSAFPDDLLISHAHAQILTLLRPDAPVVLVFVNAINLPAATPSRCYEFGEGIRRCLDELPGSERLVLYASGGLSHFSAGYPYREYGGPLTMGDISEDFDRRVLSWIEAGDADALKSLSSKDLLDNGEVEFRQWLVLLGALRGTEPESLVYEPMYRGLMGMGVGFWRS